MYDSINETMFEFAQTIQSLIKLGWAVGEISYGERRFGIGPSIILSKDEKTVTCYSHADIEDILRKEWEDK